MCLKLIRMEKWAVIVLIILPPCLGLSIAVPPLADRTTPGGESDEYEDPLSPGEQVALILAILVAAILFPSMCCWGIVVWIRGRPVEEADDEGPVVFMNMTRIVDEESPTIPYISTDYFRHVRGSSSPPPDYNEHAFFPMANFSNNNTSVEVVTDDLPPPSFDEATRSKDLKSSETESEQVIPIRGRKKWKEIIRKITANRK